MILQNTTIAAIDVGIEVLKRANGYKPFLYNITVNGCKLLKNPRSNPVAWYFFSAFQSFTNINHSCPFTVSILVNIEVLYSVEKYFFLSNLGYSYARKIRYQLCKQSYNQKTAFSRGSVCISDNLDN